MMKYVHNNQKQRFSLSSPRLIDSALNAPFLTHVGEHMFNEQLLTCCESCSSVDVVPIVYWVKKLCPTEGKVAPVAIVVDMNQQNCN